MAIIKQNHRLEKAEFIFDSSGDVSGLELTVNIQLFDNTTGEELTQIRQIKDIWNDLTFPQKTQGNTVGKKMKSLAEAF